MKQTGIEDIVEVQRSDEFSDLRLEALREKYFSQIPCPVLVELHKVYIMDFEMFEYDPVPFFKLCKEEKKTGR